MGIKTEINGYSYSMTFSLLQVGPAQLRVLIRYALATMLKNNYGISSDVAKEDFDDLAEKNGHLANSRYSHVKVFLDLVKDHGKNYLVSHVKPFERAQYDEF